MRNRIEKALELAKRVHAGQTYKHPDGDKDYFEYHVKNVYNRLFDLNSDGDAEVVAVLHDVLEDCKAEEKGSIRKEIYETFGDTIELALLFLDRNISEANGVSDYQGYIERVAANEIAAFVKIHDLQENLFHCLLLNASGYAMNKLLPKYVKALVSRRTVRVG